MELPKGITSDAILDSAIEAEKTNPVWQEFATGYIHTLKRLENFKNKYSAHDLKETLFNISKQDMFEILGTEASDEAWNHFQLAMQHLYEIQDSDLSALIEFHKSRD